MNELTNPELRIDHMKYLPDMEDIGSEIQDKVIAAMNLSLYTHLTLPTILLV